MTAEQNAVRKINGIVAMRMNEAMPYHTMLLSHYIVLCNLPKYTTKETAKTFGFARECNLRYALVALIKQGWVKREREGSKAGNGRYAYSHTPEGTALFNLPERKPNKPVNT